MLFDAPTPAGWLTGAVTGAPENAWEYIGIPIDHVGVGVALLGDEPDVLRHGSVGRACPLTIHYLVKVVGVVNIGRFH